MHTAFHGYCLVGFLVRLAAQLLTCSASQVGNPVAQVIVTRYGFVERSVASDVCVCVCVRVSVAPCARDD